MNEPVGFLLALRKLVAEAVLAVVERGRRLPIGRDERLSSVRVDPVADVLDRHR
jgi:hypothetical protein